ncbi:MAG TPA: hypothetical protein VFC44_21835 [Candidatus Saccharimonadales bacterium]|nr:hypothetical protein [Candidatus Saccharimonadales bacterium]
MKDSAAFFLFTVALLSLCSLAPAEDLLKFVDGSALHGELQRMDVNQGVRWENPDAKNPIDFAPAHIDSIQFAHADSLSLAPTCHLRFANGDDLFGSVNSLDQEHLGFSTWFGGAMTIPRAAVQSITFLSSNYTILYEGPYDMQGWVTGNNPPESWALRDGAFIATGPGALGRDFKLTGSSTVEFDLAWNELFEFVVDLYTDALDHLDYNTSSYLVGLTASQVSLRRSGMTRGFVAKSFGDAAWTLPPGKNKIHVAIQSNKDEATLAVFIDNVLIKRWTDPNGFTATGGGILFVQAGMGGTGVKVSNIRVSQWTGRTEPETAAVVTNVDAIRLVNHDQADGKIMNIKDNQVSLALGGTVLQVPLQRVTQINFATPATTTPANDPWNVRALFPGGGSLSFQLEKWNGQEVAGRSAIFGRLAFQPSAIRELEFNLDRPRPQPKVVTETEFEGLDE